VLATIVRRWRLELAPGQKIGLSPTITLRSKYGMRMRVEAPGYNPRQPIQRQVT